jgi:SAM-dependent methyltransferase
MSHPEQLGFFEAVADANTELLSGCSMLEVGSYDVNGTVRAIFDPASNYVGVDLVQGPGVDVVGYGHELDYPDGAFDAVISGECFEHDPHWTDTFTNMARMTRPGGLVAFTCASRGRPEHGTRRTDARDSPGTQSEGLDYYRNLTQEDFAREVRLADTFDEHGFWFLKTSFDLYFAGVRSGEPAPGQARAQLPDPVEVRELQKLMPVAHRIVRLPLRPFAVSLREERYQSVIRPYWALALRLGGRLGARLGTTVQRTDEKRP